MTSNVRNWALGEGGQIARSLWQGLQLPEDVHYFSDRSDEALATRLQWHSIAVKHLTFYFIYFYYFYFNVYIYIYTFYFLLFFGIIIDIVIIGSAIGLHDGRQIEGCYRGG